jgi:hypothetical protein
MSDAERVALNDEQIRQYCMLSAAEAGIPIPGPEPVPFVEARPGHDQVLFTLGGFCFTDRETVAELQEFLRTRVDKMRKTDSDWRYTGSIEYVTDFGDVPDIGEKRVYSAERRVKLREELERWGSRKAESDKECNAWRKDRDAYDSHCKYIFEMIGDAKQRINSQTRNQARFNEYLRLAGGDSGQAWIFFCAAKLELEGFRPVGAPPIVAPAEVAS